MNDSPRLPPPPEPEPRQAKDQPEDKPPDWSPITGAPTYYTSLDPSTEEGLAYLMKAKAKADQDATAVAGKVVPVANLFAHLVYVQGKVEGEMVQAVRCVLIGPDGTTTAFVSLGVLDAIRLLVQARGRPPWNPPLDLAVQPAKTNRGFTTYNLHYVPKQLPKPKGK